jgi:hypothetical protein
VRSGLGGVCAVVGGVVRSGLGLCALPSSKTHAEMCAYGVVSALAVRMLVRARRTMWVGRFPAAIYPPTL